MSQFSLTPVYHRDYSFDRFGMRRLLSITTIFALIASLTPQLWAAACSDSKQIVACHRPSAQASKVHHCDGMAQTESRGPSSTEFAPAEHSPGDCPMDCCAQRHQPTSATLPALTAVPQLTVSDLQLAIVPITFSTPGFSSHTDRGPPLV